MQYTIGRALALGVTAGGFLAAVLMVRPPSALRLFEENRAP